MLRDLERKSIIRKVDTIYVLHFDSINTKHPWRVQPNQLTKNCVQSNSSATLRYTIWAQIKLSLLSNQIWINSMMRVSDYWSVVDATAFSFFFLLNTIHLDKNFANKWNYSTFWGNACNWHDINKHKRWVDTKSIIIWL